MLALHMSGQVLSVVSTPALQACSVKRVGGAAPQGFVLFNAGHFAQQAVHFLNGCECASAALALHAQATINHVVVRLTPPMVCIQVAARHAATSAAVAACSRIYSTLSQAATPFLTHCNLVFCSLNWCNPSRFRACAARRYEEGAKLRCEMARKNMYVRTDDRPTKAYRPEGGTPYGTAYGSGAGAGGGSAGVDRNVDNPPCNTLFIGNLSPAVSDEAIENYFRNVKGDGFVQCKVNRSNPSRVSAFVQFAEIPIAQEVHASEQGKELPGSDRGPMRIQFSKNPLGEFGKRRREEEAYGGGYGGGSNPGEAPPPTAAYAAPPAGADGAPQYGVAPPEGAQQPQQAYGVAYAPDAAAASPQYGQPPGDVQQPQYGGDYSQGVHVIMLV